MAHWPDGPVTVDLIHLRQCSLSLLQTATCLLRYCTSNTDLQNLSLHTELLFPCHGSLFLFFTLFTPHHVLDRLDTSAPLHLRCFPFPSSDCATPAFWTSGDTILPAPARHTVSAPSSPYALQHLEIASRRSSHPRSHFQTLPWHRTSCPTRDLLSTSLLDPSFPSPLPSRPMMIPSQDLRYDRRSQHYANDFRRPEACRTCVDEKIHMNCYMHT